VSKHSGLTNYFVFATSTSGTHSRALEGSVEEAMEKAGEEVIKKEGAGSDWLCLDLGDIIVHIFTKEIREHYNIEKLWTEGKNYKTFETMKKEVEKLNKKQVKAAAAGGRGQPKAKPVKEKPVKEKKVKAKSARPVKEKTDSKIKTVKPAKK